MRVTYTCDIHTLRGSACADTAYLLLRRLLSLGLAASAVRLEGYLAHLRDLPEKSDVALSSPRDFG